MSKQIKKPTAIRMKKMAITWIKENLTFPLIKEEDNSITKECQKWYDDSVKEMIELFEKEPTIIETEKEANKRGANWEYKAEVYINMDGNQLYDFLSYNGEMVTLGSYEHINKFDEFLKNHGWYREDNYSWQIALKRV